MPGTASDGARKVMRSSDIGFLGNANEKVINDGSEEIDHQRVRGFLQEREKGLTQAHPDR
jgi:hypothetical protein